MGRAFVRPFVGTLLLTGLVYALVVLFGASDPEAPSKAVLVPVAFVYGLFVGFWPALAVGGLRLSWKLVGGWTLVPMLLLPAAVGLALWAAAGTLQEQATGIWDAARLAGAEREWVSAALGRAAHAGPLILIFLVPLLLIDLGAIALDPGVLWSVATLFFTFALVVVGALVPASLVSILVLARAYLKGLRARVRARDLATT